MTWITGSIDGLTESDIEVMAGTEDENYSGNGWSASVTLRVPWDKRHALLANILNNRLDWPYRTGLGIRASGVSSVKGIGATNRADNKNVYNKADIAVDFSRVSVGGGTGTGAPNGGEGSYVYHENIEPNGEMLKLPPSGVWKSTEEGEPDVVWQFHWGEDFISPVVSKDEAPTKLITGLDYVIRWEGLDAVPSQILTVRDHVNEEDVVSAALGITFPAESMLCTAVHIGHSGSSGGESSKFDMEVRWSIRYEGWNKFWNPITGTWQQMYLHIGYPDQDDYEVHEYDNFPVTDLFAYLLP